MGYDRIPKRIDPQYSNFDSNTNEIDIYEENNTVYYFPDREQNDSPLSVFSFIIGLLSVLLCWVPVLPLISGVIGVFLASQDSKRAEMCNQDVLGTSVAGKTCSIVGIIINIIIYSVILILSYGIS